MTLPIAADRRAGNIHPAPTTIVAADAIAGRGRTDSGAIGQRKAAAILGRLGIDAKAATIICGGINHCISVNSLSARPADGAVFHHRAGAWAKINTIEQHPHDGHCAHPHIGGNAPGVTDAAVETAATKHPGKGVGHAAVDVAAMNRHVHPRTADLNGRASSGRGRGGNGETIQVQRHVIG